MLAFRRVQGSLSGQNITQTVAQVFQEYEIKDQIGYFVLDNAESNDTVVVSRLYFKRLTRN